CSATRSRVGNHGTDDISQVLLNCTFAAVFIPFSCATFQCFNALGPGPTAEIEYSPIRESMPPLLMGKSHSLTDINHTSFGNNLIISVPSPCPFQPQSH